LGLSIAGVGGAEPDRSWGWSEQLRIAHWALVAQLAVRPKVVVAMSEVFDNDTGFGQGPELLAVQALVPEPAMEALHEPVLPRTGRLDVNGLDLVLRQPPLHFLGNELRPVVAAQVLRRSLTLPPAQKSEVTSVGNLYNSFI
jgi:hypothetical protein